MQSLSELKARRDFVVDKIQEYEDELSRLENE